MAFSLQLIYNFYFLYYTKVVNKDYINCIMDIKKLILKKIEEGEEVRASEIVKETGYSRTYINRFFQELRDEGEVILVGRANNARYILATMESIEKTKREFNKFQRIYTNKNLSEDEVFDEIKKETGIFLDLRKNVDKILNYAFTEMMNNAIEHSRSKNIEVLMIRDSVAIRFDVNDQGIGIFNNIAQKKGLHSEIEAIQDLLKGKETTSPEKHSGEGIFFTSKVGDTLIIKSGTKKLIFNNKLEDIFIKDIKKTKGTKVTFTASIDSKTQVTDVFRGYTEEGTFEFTKTRIIVKLYKMGTEYISRSQARRISIGLEKFRTIILDFKNVETVGQAFADEIFRVWSNKNSGIKLEYKNANENIEFMIRRAKAKR